jgi:hypothetical protein
VFYGSAAASNFASKFYNLPLNYDLLPLGVDDDLIEEVMLKDKIKLKHYYGFDTNDFIIITGCKIDEKKRTIELINSFISIKYNVNIKLIIFLD